MLRVLRCSAPLFRWRAAGAPLPCCGCSVLLLRSQAVWSPPLFTVCVCDLCRVRVLVRLSHPRPPDRNQQWRTVGVLPGPTRVLPMPKQYGTGRRAQTRAVLSCAALWCLGGASSTSSCGLSRPYVLLCVLSQCVFRFFVCVFLFFIFVCVFLFFFFVCVFLFFVVFFFSIFCCCVFRVFCVFRFFVCFLFVKACPMLIARTRTQQLQQSQ